MDITFKEDAATECSDAFVAELSTLFSSQYGIWGLRGPTPGISVKLSSMRLRRTFLHNSSQHVVSARDLNGALVGHVIFSRFSFLSGNAVFVTQLVVASPHRSKRIAARLIGLALTATKNLCAVGIASSHPHAVRAVERAFNTTYRIPESDSFARLLIESSEVPHLQGCRVRISKSPPTSAIDTQFFVDHTEVRKAADELIDWNVGSIGDGEEYIAVFFRDEIGTCGCDPTARCFRGCLN